MNTLRKRSAWDTQLARKTCGLNSEKLREGIRKLTEITGNNNIFFWGTISGLKKDYIILAAYNFNAEKYFPKIEYYWR